MLCKMDYFYDCTVRSQWKKRFERTEMYNTNWINIIEIYQYKVVDMKGEDLDLKWILFTIVAFWKIGRFENV